MTPESNPDQWLHYLLGAAVLGAFGIAGSILVKKVVEFGIGWFARVNTALEALGLLIAKVDTLLEKIKGWDINGLRNHINLLGMRSRLNSAKLEHHSMQILQIRETLTANGIDVPPAPDINFRMRDEDKDILEALVNMNKIRHEVTKADEEEIG